MPSNIFKKIPSKKVLLSGLFIGALLFFGISSFFEVKSQHNSNGDIPFSEKLISPNGEDISVKVFDTVEIRTLGLSYHTPIPTDHGALFVFPDMDRHGFWMKEMQFPLDIIWMDEGFVVVDRVINAQPSSFPEVFTPREKAMYVLELNAHSTDKYGIIVGSKMIKK
jgi:uncharacterized membrane protein (UPF0127 family)